LTPSGVGRVYVNFAMGVVGQTDTHTHTKNLQLFLNVGQPIRIFLNALKKLESNVHTYLHERKSNEVVSGK
jgi:hypothetical protein